MNIGRNRYVSRLLRRRKRYEREALRKESHWLDVWLPRISHFSQFGLFVATIGGFYFTVLPLYQKAVLEEAIARKEVELAASEKSLEQSYVRLRGFSIKEFVFSTGAECSSLMNPPRALRTLEEKTPSGPSEAEEILSIDAGACIKEKFQNSKPLTELHSADRQTLASYIDRIVTNLTVKREAARIEFNSIPQRAKANPSILKPLNSFSERMLTLLSKSQTPAWIEASRFSLAVKETQSAVAHEYDSYVRSQVATLRSINWQPSR